MTVNVDELAKAYQEKLKEEGYGCKDPVKDEDANTLDLTVKFEGMSYLVVLDYDDPEFVRIILPNFYTIEQDKIPQALAAVHVVAKRCKGAKVYLNSDFDDTMSSAEFLDNGNSIDAALLIRYLSMVRNAALVFASEMVEDEGEETEEEAAEEA